MNKLFKQLLIILMAVMCFSLNTNVSVYADSTTSITDEVATKIKNANTSSSTRDDEKINTLYAIGEANLTDSDVVTVNGVACYVLSVDTTNNTAQLITKNIYDARFDNGGHDSSTPNLGTNVNYTDKTHNYKYSTLKTYMDSFYTDRLGSDSRIIQTNAKYYVGESSISSTTTPTGTVSQYVYALDAVEAENNKCKFGSSSWNFYNAYNAYRDDTYTNNCFGFWLSAGYSDDNNTSAFIVGFNSVLTESGVNGDTIGARPAFTIDLTVSPSSPTDNNNGGGSGDGGSTNSDPEPTKVVTCEEAYGAGWYWDDAKGCQFKAPRTDVK